VEGEAAAGRGRAAAHRYQPEAWSGAAAGSTAAACRRPASNRAPHGAPRAVG